MVHVGRPPTIEAMAFAADHTVTPRRYTAKPDDVSAVLDRLRAGLIDGRALLKRRSGAATSPLAS